MNKTFKELYVPDKGVKYLFSVLATDHGRLVTNY